MKVLFVMLLITMLGKSSIGNADGDYYTLSEIRQQAVQGWHETYTDKYGRVRQVDIDVEVFGEESAPVLVVGWPDDGLQLFYIGDTSPSDAILAAEKGNGVTVYPFDFPTGMKIELDKQYLEEYENNLTLREMYDFVKEHLQAQGVDQEYVWEQPRVFNIVYSQNKKTESVLVPGYYSMRFWPKYFDLPILSNIANSFVRSLDGPVTSAKLYFDMSNYTEYYGGGTNWDVKEVRRCLKMAKASHERQRLFLQHFWASENRVQKKRHSRNYFHKEFPSGMSYKPAGKDDGIFRPLPKRLFWILWCRWRMLRARLNSSHSAATFVLPRSRKRLKSRSCFTYAKLPSA